MHLSASAGSQDDTPATPERSTAPLEMLRPLESETQEIKRMKSEKDFLDTLSFIGIPFEAMAGTKALVTALNIDPNLLERVRWNMIPETRRKKMALELWSMVTKWSVTEFGSRFDPLSSEPHPDFGKAARKLVMNKTARPRTEKADLYASHSSWLYILEDVLERQLKEHPEDRDTLAAEFPHQKSPTKNERYNEENLMGRHESPEDAFEHCMVASQRAFWRAIENAKEGPVRYKLNEEPPFEDWATPLGMVQFLNVFPHFDHDPVAFTEILLKTIASLPAPAIPQEITGYIRRQMAKDPSMIAKFAEFGQWTGALEQSAINEVAVLLSKKIEAEDGLPWDDEGLEERCRLGNECEDAITKYLLAHPVNTDPDRFIRFALSKQKEKTAYKKQPVTHDLIEKYQDRDDHDQAIYDLAIEVENGARFFDDLAAAESFLLSQSKLLQTPNTDTVYSYLDLLAALSKYDPDEAVALMHGFLRLPMTQQFIANIKNGTVNFYAENFLTHIHAICYGRAMWTLPKNKNESELKPVTVADLPRKFERTQRSWNMTTPPSKQILQVVEDGRSFFLRCLEAYFCKDPTLRKMPDAAALRECEGEVNKLSDFLRTLRRDQTIYEYTENLTNFLRAICDWMTDKIKDPSCDSHYITALFLESPDISHTVSSDAAGTEERIGKQKVLQSAMDILGTGKKPVKVIIPVEKDRAEKLADIWSAVVSEGEVPVSPPSESGMNESDALGRQPHDEIRNQLLQSIDRRPEPGGLSSGSDMCMPYVSDGLSENPRLVALLSRELEGDAQFLVQSIYTNYNPAWGSHIPSQSDDSFALRSLMTPGGTAGESVSIEWRDVIAGTALPLPSGSALHSADGTETRFSGSWLQQTMTTERSVRARYLFASADNTDPSASLKDVLTQLDPELKQKLTAPLGALTDLPEPVRTELKELQTQMDSMTYEDIVEKTKDIIERWYEYSFVLKNPEYKEKYRQFLTAMPHPEGPDPYLAFIHSLRKDDESIQGRGVCGQLATLLISALRQLGVPCAFATGYVAHEKEVTSNHAHAFALVPFKGNDGTLSMKPVDVHTHAVDFATANTIKEIRKAENMHRSNEWTDGFSAKTSATHEPDMRGAQDTIRKEIAAALQLPSVTWEETLTLYKFNKAVEQIKEGAVLNDAFAEAIVSDTDIDNIRIRSSLALSSLIGDVLVAGWSEKTEKIADDLLTHLQRRISPDIFSLLQAHIERTKKERKRISDSIIVEPYPEGF